MLARSLAHTHTVHCIALLCFAHLLVADSPVTANPERPRARAHANAYGPAVPLQTLPLIDGRRTLEDLPAASGSGSSHFAQGLPAAAAAPTKPAAINKIAPPTRAALALLEAPEEHLPVLGAPQVCGQRREYRARTSRAP